MPELPATDPRLSRRIREAAERDALGHALILSGRGDLSAEARFTAAALQCRGADKPCGTCPDCRKILRGVHPDVVTVVDPEHKNISVDVLRGVAADASILPNEGRRKVYIFPDCSLLDGKAQNVLLKVVEDGPPHAAFLFCAENSAVLLPTIRSRTVEWKLSPPRETGAADDRACLLCQLICDGKAPDLAAFCAELENSRISREELKLLLSDTRDILTAALASAYGAERGPLAEQVGRGMDKRRLSNVIDRLGAFIRQCGYNTGVGHLTGAMAVELADNAPPPVF